MSVTTATATELWRLSATDLAQAIRSKQTSSQEVIEAHLRRIEAVNPAVNAVTVVLGERALEAAKAADRVVAAGGKLPLLHGVPFTVKGNMDLVGTPTTMGVRALAGACPTLDAPTVKRMRAAGAIPIGRTNCSNFTLRWHTDSELWGATINPWDRTRTPGASSGGEAAALDEGRVAETIRSMRMAIAANTLGLPAVALPVGIGDGLPQAVQVIGPRCREDLCLDAAAAVEDRVGVITPIDPR